MITVTLGEDYQYLKEKINQILICSIFHYSTKTSKNENIKTKLISGGVD